MKKVIVISVISIVVILGLLVGGYFLYTNNTYNNSLENWQAGDRFEAIKGFYKVRDYKDSDKYLEEFESEVLIPLCESAWDTSEKPYTNLTHYNDGYKAEGFQIVTLNEDYTGTRTVYYSDSMNYSNSINSNADDFYFDFDWKNNHLCLCITDDMGRKSIGQINFSDEDTLSINNIVFEVNFFGKQQVEHYAIERER